MELECPIVLLVYATHKLEESRNCYIKHVGTTKSIAMLSSFSLLVPRSYKLFAIHKCLFPTPSTLHFTLPPSITNLIQCTSQIRKNMQSTKSTLFIYLCALLKICSKNQKGNLQRKPFKQRKKQTPLEAGCSLTL